jgi:hypothetical protein
VSGEREADAAVPATSSQVVEASAARAAVPAHAPAPVLAPAAIARVAAAPLARHAAALEGLQTAAGQLVPQLQYQIMRLGTAGQAGLAALVAAFAVAIGALVPAYHALQTLNADLAGAQHPTAVNNIEQALPRLVESLPTRAQIPAVLAHVFAEARSAGVSLNTGHYVYTPAKAGTIAHYELEFPVKAGYPEIRTFINRTLTAVPAAVLDKLHLERKTVGDQVVNADIGFVVYVRTGEGS